MYEILWYTTLEVTMMKLPPLEKIPEALSVLADKRYAIYEDHADIISSNHAKTYTVLFDGTTYASNDSATYWQGYPGYPIIAVWFLQELLPVPNHILPYFKGIDWHKRNEKHKRRYAQALQEVLEEQQLSEEEMMIIKASIQHIYELLSTLFYTIKRNTKKPIALN